MSDLYSTLERESACPSLFPRFYPPLPFLPCFPPLRNRIFPRATFQFFISCNTRSSLLLVIPRHPFNSIFSLHRHRSTFSSSRVSFLCFLFLFFQLARQSIFYYSLLLLIGIIRKLSDLCLFISCANNSFPFVFNKIQDFIT